MELRVPASGDSVDEVELIEWLASEGQQLNEGDPVYSIETGKTVIEVTAPTAGVLRVIAAKGATLAVGDLVGHIE